MIDKLIESDLMKAMSIVCLNADKQGIDPWFTNVMRQVIKDYEKGDWNEFDLKKKNLFIQSIDYPLFGPPGAVYEFQGSFSGQALEVFGQFTRLLHQYGDQLRLELSDKTTSVTVEDSLCDNNSNMNTPSPLTIHERELSAVLQEMSLSPEMGVQFMAACILIRNLLTGTSWQSLNPGEKQRNLELLNSPDFATDMDRNPFGHKLRRLVQAIKSAL